MNLKRIMHWPMTPRNDLAPWYKILTRLVVIPILILIVPPTSLGFNLIRFLVALGWDINFDSTFFIDNGDKS